LQLFISVQLSQTKMEHIHCWATSRWWFCICQRSRERNSWCCWKQKPSFQCSTSEAL